MVDCKKNLPICLFSFIGLMGKLDWTESYLVIEQQ